MRFMVAFGIRKFANAKTLECWPSQARLAAEARVTSRTVQAEIAALRDRGHLEVICSANKRLGNRYRLLKRPETANAASREKSHSMRSSVRMGESTSCERGFAWPSEPAFARNLVKEPLNPSSTALLPSSADLCLEEPGLDVDQSQTEISGIVAADQEESERFLTLLGTYPCDSTMALEEAERLFGALSIEDQRKAIRSVKIYAEDIKRRGRSHPMELGLPLFANQPNAGRSAPGQKELALLDAERAGEGTEWGDDFRRLNL